MLPIILSRRPHPAPSLLISCKFCPFQGAAQPWPPGHSPVTLQAHSLNSTNLRLISEGHMFPPHIFLEYVPLNPQLGFRFFWARRTNGSVDSFNTQWVLKIRQTELEGRDPLHQLIQPNHRLRKLRPSSLVSDLLYVSIASQCQGRN